MYVPSTARVAGRFLQISSFGLLIRCLQGADSRLVSVRTQAATGDTCSAVPAATGHWPLAAAGPFDKIPRVRLVGHLPDWPGFTAILAGPVSFLCMHGRFTRRKGLPPLPESWRKMAKKRSVTPNGDALRAARLQKAWTTDDLARHTDCSVKTVENAERGKAIYAITLARIASALGVDYDSLIARPVEQSTPTKLDTIISTTRIEATFGLLAREDQHVYIGWFLEHLRNHIVRWTPFFRPFLGLYLFFCRRCQARGGGGSGPGSGGLPILPRGSIPTSRS
jgi:transcriptional regulator with XRE-family HTH domain